MLKPSDIEHKTFSTALRGYDLNEVDDFLDEVIATIRDLEEQVASSKPGKQAAVQHDPVHDESAVGRALIAAQAAADRLLEEAGQEAERIRAEARTEADGWVNDREAMKAEADRDMAELTDRVSHVRRELAVLATAVADGLDQMDAAIEAAVLPMSMSTDRAAQEIADQAAETTDIEVEVDDADTDELRSDREGESFGESWGSESPDSLEDGAAVGVGDQAGDDEDDNDDSGDDDDEEGNEEGNDDWGDDDDEEEADH